MSKRGAKYQVHGDRCFHILITGDVVLDIEAKDGAETKQLIEGFQSISRAFFSEESLYIGKLVMYLQIWKSALKWGIN